jgi:hypothetical protein
MATVTTNKQLNNQSKTAENVNTRTAEEVS